MSTRKWLIRGLIPVFIGLAIALGSFVSNKMKPAYIREEVLLHLQKKFQNVDIEVGSAHLRFFGGITAADITMIRKDDPERKPLLHIPKATLQVDKERLSKGELIIRKIELEGPTIRIVREVDGKFNWTNIISPHTDDEPVPVFAVNEAHIFIEDRRAAEPRSLGLDLSKLVMVNDPKTLYRIEGQGRCELFGPISFKGSYDEQATMFSLTGDLNEIPVRSEQIDWLSAYAANIRDKARDLRGTGQIHFEVEGQHEPEFRINPTARFELKGGSYSHPDLPGPLSELQVKGRYGNDSIIIDKASARTGESLLTLDGEIAVNGFKPKPVVLVGKSASRTVPDTDSMIRRLNVQAEHVVLKEALFRKLPAQVQEIQKMFQPDGPVDIGYHRGMGEFGTEIRWSVAPREIRGRYEDFPYTVERLHGKIESISVPGQPETIQINLLGSAKGQPVKVEGRISSLGQPDKAIYLKISGEGIVLDEELIAALPAPYPQLVRRLRPKAKANFTATIKHDAQIRFYHHPDTFDNTIDIDLIDSSLNYRDFPYPLNKVNGKLYIKTVPDRPTRLPDAQGLPQQLPPVNAVDDGTVSVEFRNFTAEHGTAKFRISGQRVPATGGNMLDFGIEAVDMPFDLELRESLARLKLDNVWETFDLQGRMNCRMQARVFERAKSENDTKSDFEPKEDLFLSMACSGATARPQFFPWLLNDIRGQLIYYRGKVVLENFEARHNASIVTLPKTEVILNDNGGYRAEVKDLSIRPLELDREFLAALPQKLRAGLGSLELSGGLSLMAKQLIVEGKAGPRAPAYLPTHASKGGINLPSGDSIRQVAFRPAAIDPQTEQTPHRTPSPNEQSLSSPPTISWDGTLQMNDVSFTAGIDWNHANGQFVSNGVMEGDKPGAINAKLVLDRATLLKQPVENILINMFTRPDLPDRLIVDAIQAKIYGGEVSGEANLLLNDRTWFNLKLNGSRLHLSEFARTQNLDSKSKLEGLASGRIYLTNAQHLEQGQPLLEGVGGIDIPNGSKILNVPEILNLFKTMKLHLPDQTFFEEAHATFRVRGNRIYFGQIDLLGDAVNLGGEGGMDLNGRNVKLDFYTISRFHDMLNSPLSSFTAGMSKSLLKIEVRGDLDGKLDYKSQPIPLFAEPLKRLLEK